MSTHVECRECGTINFCCEWDRIECENGHGVEGIWPPRAAVMRDATIKVAMEKILNHPEINIFVDGAIIEAQHQRMRWGEEHDAKKTDEDWLWLIAYLATKATRAARYGDKEKCLHHIITTAAACANWHRSRQLREG